MVFSHRVRRTDRGSSFMTLPTATATPARSTPRRGVEWQGRVSPDGKLVAFMSDREPEAGNEADIWVRELSPAGEQRRGSRRVTRAPGVESHPAWAPDNARVAFAAAAQGAARGLRRFSRSDGCAGRGRGGAAPGARRGAVAPAAAARRGAAPRFSRRVMLGVPAWSPDGETLLIATFATTNAGYNGNPKRNDNDPPTRAGGRESVRALARARAARGR